MADLPEQNLGQDSKLFREIRVLLDQARAQIKRTIDTTIVQTYWQIGRLIVEDEQQGEARADYGNQVLIALSKLLTTIMARVLRQRIYGICVDSILLFQFRTQ